MGKNFISAQQAAELLTEYYRFRKNILSGKVEFMKLDSDTAYRIFTKDSLNTISHHAKMEGLECTKTDMEEIIYSEETPLYNPIQEYIDNLSAWDGTDRVTPLWQRLGNLSDEQLEFLHIWHLSCVAHWLQMDALHGNETVPVLIGWQGARKTTFLKKLLPEKLRTYFMDQLNITNRFDKDMALTNNLLVNLDELEAIRPSQQAALKQLLSRSRVVGRPIYGTAQDDKPRFASFTATTNDPHPLSDVTGTRRFIAIQIADNYIIDVETETDYEQLYAQLKHEVVVLKQRYWFTNEQTKRIQELNVPFLKTEDMEQMISTCFRKPKKGEDAQNYTTNQIMDIIRKQYPHFSNNHAHTVSLGMYLKNMGFTNKRSKNAKTYQMIQKKAA